MLRKLVSYWSRKTASNLILSAAAVAAAAACSMQPKATIARQNTCIQTTLQKLILTNATHVKNVLTGAPWMLLIK